MARIVINTNTKAWNVEKRMYGFGDIVLPKPLALSTIGFLALGLLVAVIVNSLPVLSHLPWAVKWLGIPAGVAWLMSKVTPHSKSTMRFIISYFAYLMQPKEMVKFRPVKKEKPVYFGTIRKG